MRGSIHELIDKVGLPCEDSGQIRLVVPVELVEGMEIGEHIEPDQRGLVDDECDLQFFPSTSFRISPLIPRGVIGPLKVGSVVFVPFYPGIEVKIKRAEQSIGFVAVCDFDPLRMRIMIQEQDLFADQCNGSFIEFAVEGNGAVLGDPASGMVAKMVLEILRHNPEALHARGETGERTLPGGSVLFLMVDIVDPQIKGLIEVAQICALEGKNYILTVRKNLSILPFSILPLP